MIRTAVVGACCAAGLVLAACGSGEEDADAAAARQQKARDAGLKFARCMRENGVDIPDPQVGDGGMIRIGPRPGAAGEERPSPARFRKAEQACRKHLEAIEPPQLSPEQEKEFRERALAHAKCMREHGVDFPDPTFNDKGGVEIRIRPGSGAARNSPNFRRAVEACRGEGGGPLGLAPRASGDGGQ